MKKNSTHTEETKQKMREKRKKRIGVLSPNYKGLKNQKKYCVNCGEELNKRAIYDITLRCHSCANKGKLNPNWKENKTKKYCINCNKEIWTYSHSLRCAVCATKYNYLIGKLKPKKGESCYWYKDGATLNIKCIDCGVKIKNVYAKRCTKCYGLSIRGMNNWNYKDGTAGIYPPEFYQLRETIRKRDNYQCQNKECNMVEEEHLIIYGINLHIHHIDYNKKNSNENNLLALCLQCNLRANYNRNYWSKYYNEIIKSIEAIKAFVVKNTSPDAESKPSEVAGQANTGAEV